MLRVTEPRNAADRTAYRYEQTTRRYVGWFSPEPPLDPAQVRLWLLTCADCPSEVKDVLGRNFNIELTPMFYEADPAAMHYVYSRGRMVLSYT